MNKPEQINPYGLTAARRHARPGRETRPASITVDAHSHVWSTEAAAFVQPHLDPSSVSMTRMAPAETLELMRKQASDRRPQQTDWNLRLSDMDGMGVDVQIITPVPGQMYRGLPLEIAVKAAAIVNDNIAAFAANRPDRFRAIGIVPMQDGAAAAEELERSVRKLGLAGVQLPTNVDGKEISDPSFEPLWAKAEELGVVVFIHPSGFTHPQRLSRFYLNNTIGNPLETTIALHYIIFDGVLERYPNLKIVAPHGGGFAAAYSGRMDHAWGARNDAHANLPHPPTTYLKRIHFDTIVFTPHQLDYLIRTFGADHILIGTDYPADMGEYDPLGLLASLPSLAPADLAAIAGGNAARLYGIQSP